MIQVSTRFIDLYLHVLTLQRCVELGVAARRALNMQMFVWLANHMQVERRVPSHLRHFECFSCAKISS